MPPNPIPNPSWLTLIVLSIVARVRGKKKKIGAAEGPTAHPTYSILIPAHNEDAIIGRALLCCASQTVKPDRVVVLDDASDCNYAPIVDTTYPKAEIIRSETRRGKAFNIARIAQEIDSDFVLVLDADSYVEPLYMEKILAAKPFDVAFGTVMPDDESGKAIYGRQRLVEYVFGQAVWKRAFNLMGSPNITGCFAVYRTQLVRDIGFPSRTVTEDLDLCWTILEKNGRITYVPEARGYTREPVSFPEYNNQVNRWYQGFWQCIKSHGASGVGESNKLTLSLNFILLDQVILSPIWFAFLLGSVLLGLSQISVFAPYFNQLASSGLSGGFLSAWHRWFPFAASPILAASSVAFDFLVTTVLTFSWTRAQGRTRQAAKALPLFYLMSWYNRLVFWASGLKTILWSPAERGAIW